MQSVLSRNNRIKPEVNNRKIPRKLSNACKLNNTSVNNIGVKEKVSRETEEYFGLNDNKNTTYQNL